MSRWHEFATVLDAWESGVERERLTPAEVFVSRETRSGVRYNVHVTAFLGDAEISGFGSSPSLETAARDAVAKFAQNRARVS